MDEQDWRHVNWEDATPEQHAAARAWVREHFQKMYRDCTRAELKRRRARFAQLVGRS
jgi:hypothetical protein